MAALVISLGLMILIFILSVVFKVAGKARLTLPLLYILAAAVSTMFTDWTTKNEKPVLAGLYVLIALVIVSWVISLVKAVKRKKAEKYAEEDIAWQIKRAREMGVPLDNVRFDENNSLIDPRTGEAVNFSNGDENI